MGASYLSALAAIEGLPRDALGAQAAARAGLVERLTRHGIPYDYECPEAATARLTSMLARRPRLALSPAAQAAVGSIMPDLKARVLGQLPALLSHLAHGLSHPRYSETITG